MRFGANERNIIMADKPKGVVINSWEVKPLVLDETYSSKMILDSVVAGGQIGRAHV